jgi:hypothetical protein
MKYILFGVFMFLTAICYGVYQLLFLIWNFRLSKEGFKKFTEKTIDAIHFI